MNKQEQVMLNFRDLFNKLVWINKSKMESSLQGYKPSEVHCIEFIEKNVDSNVTKLAESMYMTKGAISKLTKKLIEKGLIEDYQKTNNKKEVFFKLTQQGRVVFDIHEKLHKEFQERDESVFKHVTEEQFDHMLDFIELYSKHLDTEIKKQGLDIMK
ncbi:MarR family transcriptional regulator [Paenibacillus polysaccharolyticus]|uniref:MarR family transcriptional regulator n=1 Tax=Paenibacillus cucumis (ex Kampfer et al. 2016) TaxID=1776858 RepID=A0ABS7KGR7_9BACL|nr:MULTISPECIES: MarR family transcriptional regulator [Paenibacillus]MBY0203146.1 MarR family transcriptional regulator [Paenibacillus cucumis (ex Kampfer et al. 2016)]MCM3135246.1 MarR family transcriptional regulator [Paenibacillus polysaccharolyticus]MCP1136172.1 MarR family transcriptional regulator [Paenibacillus polysaccharolyticus]MDP9701043.1 DNA-binding MarR family transcriptional regulator [Paenibacillus intestini]